MYRRIMGGCVSGLSAAVLALTLFTSTALAQTAALQYAELPNFHQVNSQLYRGAQPGAFGLRKLAELGIKTIINLRGEDEETRADQLEAKALGLNYVSISLPEISRPSDEQVERVLAIINAPDKQPVFVHCRHGKDRTGVIIAVYRITRDQWTGKQAKAEAKRYGLSWIQVRMKDYIADYYRDWMKAGLK